MRLNHEDLYGATETVCQTMFGLPLAREMKDIALKDESLFTGCVQISGPWTGVIAVRCEEPLARQIASIMFRRDTNISNEDLVDVLGELANMVAGIIKSLLPEEVTHEHLLSRPAVVADEDYISCLPPEWIKFRAIFEHLNHRLEIVIVERDEPLHQ